MNNNMDLQALHNSHGENHNPPHEQDGHFIHHHCHDIPWFKDVNIFDELSKHWNDCHCDHNECNDHQHDHNHDHHHHDCHACHDDHHHHDCHDHHHHLDQYTKIFGPHQHDNFPIHCHEPRPHHCNLPFSHKPPCGDGKNYIECKPAYGHIHEINGDVKMLPSFHYVYADHCNSHYDDCHGHCHDHCHSEPFPHYVASWTPYQVTGFKHHPQKPNKPTSIKTEETQKSVEIRDSLGNLRFVVSLASYVPSTGNAFEIKFKDKAFLVDVFSYCYGAAAQNIVHEGFYELDVANKFYQENVHRYELIAKVEVLSPQDINVYADKVNYHKVDHCCATCRWAKKISREDNLFEKHKVDHFIDGHHMNSSMADYDKHSDWHNHEIMTQKEKYVCMNRAMFASSECNGDIFSHEDFSVEPEVDGNGICDKYESKDECQQEPSSVQHEYDEFGHSIYKFLDKNKKGNIL